ncbi:MAG: hypothetical protein A2931_04455 [Candidatus Niyogibacteria bacterium RIFCSPLOWO2_01_FULL_45_48]|uniref:Type II secretion system protein GspG C-terminal domain-containing protein n=2 Tax=Candidatus Niyogiibacteriota TaxID=1817912 RepID=A0A1G2EWQ0_9BACT|nr:MAG: hypothetical protein A2835_02775 [Candidatus Niyogibacteria bacterium RIFCSPHIGHO2_01_FULL_45_28]OGZ29617.1 MAG: hypothetical protein A2931_04455 [Candidatus Niyogibacteria bacterium RIFCSPLOWO2_01_FULL_45_48]OGZ30236.1 MAG: hypothetical protein A3J00_01060 [Candidatus Niyogibacteria bacterium RIFCSPLOWO2_02_FULL_45_13]
MNNKPAKYGFTIVELLVVIAIAAFILSAVFVFLRDAKTRGRDARREEEIKQLQNALNVYNVNRRQFPVCALNVINSSDDCLSQALLADEATAAVPQDPLGGYAGTCLGAGSHVYCYESADGSDYTLYYNLETDSVSGKSAGWQSVRP